LAKIRRSAGIDPKKTFEPRPIIGIYAHRGVFRATPPLFRIAPFPSHHPYQDSPAGRTIAERVAELAYRQPREDVIDQVSSRLGHPSGVA